jgi:hypothetical protein
LFSSKFQFGFVVLLVAAVGLVDFGDPSFDLQMEVERVAGVPVALCGGPNAETGPRAMVDEACVAENASLGTPYVRWSALDAAGRYRGEIVFERSGRAHRWHLVDEREGGGPLTVRACVTDGHEESCEPARCVDGCDGDYVALRAHRGPNDG